MEPEGKAGCLQRRGECSTEDINILSGKDTRYQGLCEEFAIILEAENRFRVKGLEVILYENAQIRHVSHRQEYARLLLLLPLSECKA